MSTTMTEVIEAGEQSHLSIKSRTEAIAVSLELMPAADGVFDPEQELKKIWTLPKSEKKIGLSAYKQKLVRQQEAWAFCRTTIETFIESEPEVTAENILEIIQLFAQRFGFTAEQIAVAEKIVNIFIANREAIKQLRAKCTKNGDLFHALTGLRFHQNDVSQFSIKVTPLSFEITCPGYFAGEIFFNGKSKIVGFPFGGFAAASKDGNDIPFIVINSDYHKFDPAVAAVTLPHEIQHQVNRLYKGIYPVANIHHALVDLILKKNTQGIDRSVEVNLKNYEKQFVREVYRKYFNSTDPEEKPFFLREYLRMRREEALKMVQDEIFAMKSEPNHIRTTYNVFLQLNKGPLDYLWTLRENSVERNNLLWQTQVKKILIEEYEEIIDAAILSFKELEETGYPIQTVIALLTNVRLQQWPKYARRFLQQHKEDQDD